MQESSPTINLAEQKNSGAQANMVYEPQTRNIPDLLTIRCMQSFAVRKMVTSAWIRKKKRAWFAQRSRHKKDRKTTKMHNRPSSCSTRRATMLPRQRPHSVRSRALPKRAPPMEPPSLSTAAIRALYARSAAAPQCDALARQPTVPRSRALDLACRLGPSTLSEGARPRRFHSASA